MPGFDYDVIVIGSGFGGSVSALRLTEKGYRVGVLEAGRRWDASNLPKTNWKLRQSIWAPKLGLTGTQRISLLGKVTLFSAAGVGGGSLIYGNTLYEPLDDFWRDPHWAHITDWKSELAPYYDQAKRMLGVAENPRTTPADEILIDVAKDLGVEDTYHRTNVGVFFGEPGVEVDDPYFGGAGPRRSGCIHCAGCFVGCPHNAKNSTTTNYLYLAEQAGAKVHPLTTVEDVRPLPGGGYEVATVRSDRRLRKQPRRFTAEQVAFSAAALGTQKLLHKLKGEGDLPQISDRLGVLTRTNSEAILGALAPDLSTDYTEGVAITSSWHPDEHTHIEPVRYGRGSNFMSMMQTVLADDTGLEPRWRTWMREMWSQRKHVIDLYDMKHWSERTVIALVMQTLDNSITTIGKKTPFGWRMSSKQGHGEPNPTYIPIAYEAVRRMADVMGGTPGGNVGEPLNAPLTAHFIGGCTIGDSPETGVVDPYQRMYGHPGLHIVDGSAISANLGVNPSLTITAQAERAMSFWPNKGEADTRPDLGAAYVRLAPVAPTAPVVPEAAVGALRLPIVGVS
jgi:cholesterol oxidase